ncbi:trichohyalin-like [Dendronephthya gigantea]|uniref:trichohyalin-like n=1 Tax=Dendronephthya gigantea TaxID=151771 RepID=UPI00106CFF08|nr:trichohyalin-like [Dendronephthya gigantea]
MSSQEKKTKRKSTMMLSLISRFDGGQAESGNETDTEHYSPDNETSEEIARNTKEEFIQATFEKQAGRIQDFKFYFGRNNRGVTGLFIRTVLPQSPLAGKIESGDQLIKVNDTDVKNSESVAFNRILDNLSGTVTLEVSRISQDKEVNEKEELEEKELVERMPSNTATMIISRIDAEKEKNRDEIEGEQNKTEGMEGNIEKASGREIEGARRQEITPVKEDNGKQENVDSESVMQRPQDGNAEVITNVIRPDDDVSLNGDRKEGKGTQKRKPMPKPRSVGDGLFWLERRRRSRAIGLKEAREKEEHRQEIEGEQNAFKGMEGNIEKASGREIAARRQEITPVKEDYGKKENVDNESVMQRPQDGNAQVITNVIRPDDDVSLNGDRKEGKGTQKNILDNLSGTVPLKVVSWFFTAIDRISQDKEVNEKEELEEKELVERMPSNAPTVIISRIDAEKEKNRDEIEGEQNKTEGIEGNIEKVSGREIGARRQEITPVKEDNGKQENVDIDSAMQRPQDGNAEVITNVIRPDDDISLNGDRRRRVGNRLFYNRLERGRRSRAILIALKEAREKEEHRQEIEGEQNAFKGMEGNIEKASGREIEGARRQEITPVKEDNGKQENVDDESVMQRPQDGNAEVITNVIRPDDDVSLNGDRKEGKGTQKRKPMPKPRSVGDEFFWLERRRCSRAIKLNFKEAREKEEHRQEIEGEQNAFKGMEGNIEKASGREIEGAQRQEITPVKEDNGKQENVDSESVMQRPQDGNAEVITNVIRPDDDVSLHEDRKEGKGTQKRKPMPKPRSVGDGLFWLERRRRSRAIGLKEAREKEEHRQEIEGEQNAFKGMEGNIEKASGREIGARRQEITPVKEDNGKQENVDNDSVMQRPQDGNAQVITNVIRPDDDASLNGDRKEGKGTQKSILDNLSGTVTLEVSRISQDKEVNEKEELEEKELVERMPSNTPTMIISRIDAEKEKNRDEIEGEQNKSEGIEGNIEKVSKREIEGARRQEITPVKEDNGKQENVDIDSAMQRPQDGNAEVITNVIRPDDDVSLNGDRKEGKGTQKSKPTPKPKRVGMRWFPRLNRKRRSRAIVLTEAREKEEHRQEIEGEQNAFKGKGKESKVMQKYTEKIVQHLGQEENSNVDKVLGTDLANNTDCCQIENNIEVSQGTIEIDRSEAENAGLTGQIQTIQNNGLDLRVQLLEKENKHLEKENSDLMYIGALLQEESRRFPLAGFRGFSEFHDERQLRREIQRKDVEIQQLLQEKRQGTNEIDQLRREKSEIETQIQKFSKENMEMATQIQQSSEEKGAMVIQIQQYEHEKNEMAIQIQQLKQEKSEMVTRIQQLIEDEREKANEIEQLKTESVTKNNNILQCEEEKTRMSNEIRHLNEEKDEIRNGSLELQQENHNMKIEIQQLQEETLSSFITESGTVIVSNGSELGRGGYAAVYKGDFHGTEVAVKEYYHVIISPHNMKMLEREINIAARCRHPNLLQFLCATKNDQNHLLIVTELMDMTLRSFVEERKEKSRLKNHEVKFISLDVACGLNYLHSMKPSPIIHRDISSANVLLSIEHGEVRRAKISDYGSANFMEVCTTPNPGSAVYAAPEATHAQHSPKIDVFSYGVLVCEMFISEFPDKKRISHQVKRIDNDRIKKLVKHCTAEDPQERPPMSQIISLWQQIK